MNMLRALIIAVGIWATQCIAEARECPSASSSNYYFEEQSLDSDLSLDEFTREWYSKHLIAMNEPSLSCGNVAAETYRFTWLRSFHHPIAIRVTRSQSGAQLIAVELSGAGGYEPGNVLKRLSHPISEEEWNTLKAEFGEALAMKSDPDVIGMDGAEWIFESIHGDAHRVNAVWSPSDGAARHLGVHLLALSGLKVVESERY